VKGLDEARALIAGAGRIVAFTGAGISAESGVPTFRGAGGLWRSFRPEDLATPEAFHRDPKLVWEWYDWRRGLVAGATPNPGHYALAELERRKIGFVLVTQNVDGLHRRAGSRNVLRLHGDIWVLRCLECGRENIDERAALPKLPPTCECGGMQRPGVVWFGEALDAEVLDAAVNAARSAAVLISIGTSAVVHPAAGLIDIAKRAGGKIVEVNPDETPYSGIADIRLSGPAGTILPRLIPTV
jgi:NAD-dependent deacetylase